MTFTEAEERNALAFEHTPRLMPAVAQRTAIAFRATLPTEAGIYRCSFFFFTPCRKQQDLTTRFSLGFLSDWPRVETRLRRFQGTLFTLLTPRFHPSFSLSALQRDPNCRDELSATTLTKLSSIVPLIAGGVSNFHPSLFCVRLGARLILPVRAIIVVIRNSSSSSSPPE